MNYGIEELSELEVKFIEALASFQQPRNLNELKKRPGKKHKKISKEDYFEDGWMTAEGIRDRAKYKASGQNVYYYLDMLHEKRFIERTKKTYYYRNKPVHMLMIRLRPEVRGQVFHLMWNAAEKLYPELGDLQTEINRLLGLPYFKNDYKGVLEEEIKYLEAQKEKININITMTHMLISLEPQWKKTKQEAKRQEEMVKASEQR